jgi:MFS family permease
MSDSLNDEIMSSVKPKLPWVPLLASMCANLVDGATTSFFLSFSTPIVVNQFGKEENDAGYYVGYIATGYYSGQILSSFVTGWLSDRKGRKIFLLLGILSNFLSFMLFATCYSLWMAVVIRFLAGLFNSIVTMTKCICRELCDESTQARAFSLRNVGYFIGVIFGPLVASIFARPADREIFQDTFLDSKFFHKFPYAISCYVLGSLTLVFFAVVVAFVPETLKKTSNTPIEIELVSLEDSNEESSDPAAPAVEVDLEEALDSGENVNCETQLVEKEAEIAVPIESENIEPIIVLETNPSKFESLKAGRVCKAFAFIDRAVIAAVAVMGMLAYYSITSGLAFPLWATRSLEDDGLGFSDREVGTIVSLSGILPLLFQMFLFYRVDKLLGTIYAFRVSTLMYGLVIFVMPFIEIIPSHIGKYLASFTFIALQSIANTWAFGEANLLLSNSAPPYAVGRVNSLATTFSAMLRIVAPVIGSSMFAYTANLDYYYPLNYCFIFNVCSLVALLTFVVSFVLPSYLNRHRKKA